MFNAPEITGSHIAAGFPALVSTGIATIPQSYITQEDLHIRMFIKDLLNASIADKIFPSLTLVPEGDLFRLLPEAFEIGLPNLLLWSSVTDEVHCHQVGIFPFEEGLQPGNHTRRARKQDGSPGLEKGLAVAVSIPDPWLDIFRPAEQSQTGHILTVIDDDLPVLVEACSEHDSAPFKNCGGNPCEKSPGRALSEYLRIRVLICVCDFHPIIFNLRNPAMTLFMP